MMPADDTVAALREALRFSPTNLPLHQHLADTLVKLGRFPEAETAFRDALAVAPHHLRFKLGLATVFFQQEKNSQSLVLVEDMLAAADVPAPGLSAACPTASAAGRTRACRPSIPRGTGDRPGRHRHRVGGTIGNLVFARPVQ